jgi:hypothetical protein
MFYVLFMCKCVLPPGVNPTAVDKYINTNINIETKKNSNIWMHATTYIYIHTYTQKAGCESGFLVTLWGPDDGTRLRETIFFIWILSTDLILKGARSFGGRFYLCPRVKQGTLYSVKNYYEGQTPRKIVSLAFF